METILEEAGGGETVLCWSVHLITRQPKRKAQIAAVLLVTLIVSFCIFHSLWLGLAPVLALLFSLSEYVFPVRYTLTASAATARHGLTHLEIRWADVRHAYLTDEGIKLSPLLTKNSRFEPLRGVFLRFDGANQDAVIAAVRRFRSEALAHG